MVSQYHSIWQAVCLRLLAWLSVEEVRLVALWAVRILYRRFLAESGFSPALDAAGPGEDRVCPEVKIGGRWS